MKYIITIKLVNGQMYHETQFGTISLFWYHVATCIKLPLNRLHADLRSVKVFS